MRHADSNGSLWRRLFVHVAGKIVHVRDVGQWRWQQEDRRAIIIGDLYSPWAGVEAYVFRKISFRYPVPQAILTQMIVVSWHQVPHHIGKLPHALDWLSEGLR